MNRDEVKSYVKTHIRKLRDRLSLTNLQINFDFEPIEGGAMGECQASWKYQHALIILNPGAIDDVEQLAETLLHEMLHLVHAEFRMVVEMTDQVCRSDSNEARLIDFAYQRACEATVRSMIDAITFGCGLTARQFVEGVVAEPTDKVWNPDREHRVSVGADDA